MASQDYLSAIERAYQGEVYGELLYSLIAGSRDTPDHAYKWRVMAQMETETKHLMRRLVMRHGGNIVEDETSKSQARADFERYRAMPWRDLLMAFSAELAADIAEYAELEYECPPADHWVLQRLTDHEVATKRFCDLELAGHTGRSIEPVIRYCRKPPARQDGTANA